MITKNALIELSDILKQSDPLPKLPENTTNVIDKDKFKTFLHQYLKQQKKPQSDIHPPQRVPEQNNSQPPQRVKNKKTIRDLSWKRGDIRIPQQRYHLRDNRYKDDESF